MIPLTFVPNLTLTDDNGTARIVEPIEAWSGQFWYGFDVTDEFGRSYEAEIIDCENGSVLGWSA